MRKTNLLLVFLLSALFSVAQDIILEHPLSFYMSYSYDSKEIKSLIKQLKKQGQKLEAFDDKSTQSWAAFLGTVWKNDQISLINGVYDIKNPYRISVVEWTTSLSFQLTGDKQVPINPLENIDPATFFVDEAYHWDEKTQALKGLVAPGLILTIENDRVKLEKAREPNQPVTKQEIDIIPPKTFDEFLKRERIEKIPNMPPRIDLAEGFYKWHSGKPNDNNPDTLIGYDGNGGDTVYFVGKMGEQYPVANGVHYIYQPKGHSFTIACSGYKFGLLSGSCTWRTYYYDDLTSKTTGKFVNGYPRGSIRFNNLRIGVRGTWEEIYPREEFDDFNIPIGNILCTYYYPSNKFEDKGGFIGKGYIFPYFFLIGEGTLEIESKFYPCKITNDFDWDCEGINPDFTKFPTRYF